MVQVVPEAYGPSIMVAQSNNVSRTIMVQEHKPRLKSPKQKLTQAANSFAVTL